jgi:hypothetical protein
MIRSLSANQVKAIGLSTLTTLSLLLVGFVGSANAQNSIRDGLGVSTEEANQNNLFTGDSPIFQRITSVLLFLVGAISVIMLIIGGIRYVISAGDQQAVTNAKNTILYAIVGIVVAFVAYGAVEFILDQLEDSA